MKWPIALCFLLSACASMNDALTPSSSTIKDEFDGTLIVRQPPVGASSAFSEPIHSLGFEWFVRDPVRVYLSVGAHFSARTGGMTGLSFNADGQIFRAEQTNPFTKRERDIYTESARFSVTFDQFQRIAAANIVKMRVGGLGESTVSSFGPGTGAGAHVTLKFTPFLEQVRVVRLKR